MRVILAASACLGCIGLSAPAVAASGVAPPGNSGVDQYVESLPGPLGNQPLGGAGRRQGRRGGLLSARARSALEAQGPAGRAAAALAEAANPARHIRRPKGSTPASALSQRSGGGGESPIPAVGRALTGGAARGGGMGVGLPILLLAILVMGVAFVLRRRRAD